MQFFKTSGGQMPPPPGCAPGSRAQNRWNTFAVNAQ